MDMNCPRCGGPVGATYACHTYGPNENGHWMSCIGCDSAVDYVCMCRLNDEPEPQCKPDCECNWRYTHGLNPKNPRSEINEKNRPPWIAGPKPESAHGVVAKLPAIPWLWDDT